MDPIQAVSIVSTTGMSSSESAYGGVSFVEHSCRVEKREDWRCPRSRYRDLLEKLANLSSNQQLHIEHLTDNDIRNMRGNVRKWGVRLRAYIVSGSGKRFGSYVLWTEPR